ncbi:MAG: hypothetical protein ABIH23_09225 [bacterium]
MPVRTYQERNAFLVCLEDRVTMEDNLKFGRTMKEAIADQWGTILVLVNAKVINSYCLGTVFASFREARDRGKSLRVVCDQPYSLSSIGHFDPKGILPVYKSVDEAFAGDSSEETK